MNKITEIFKANKYAIIWTATYIAIVWAILLFMFNFNIFIWHHWQLLMHAELKGFAGFVFGILILAALPMYIATTSVIIRTKKPLITINIKPVIKIFTAIIPNPVLENSTVTVTNTDNTPQIAPQPPAQPGEEFPNTMPSELRGAFIRARQHIDQFAPSAFNAALVPDIPATDAAHQPEMSDMPLPTDFGFDTPSDSDFGPNISMPTFTDINFGDDNDSDADNKTSDTSPAPTSTPDDSDKVINYLNEHGHTARRNGDLIIANNIIIATHDDSDFWIADTENWFAAGKQIASPITQLIKTSAQHGLRPVLYLAQTNIMDLDTCRAEWDKMGVTVITDLSELPL